MDVNSVEASSNAGVSMELEQEEFDFDYLNAASNEEKQ
jgi:hypothetical protein